MSRTAVLAARLAAVVLAAGALAGCGDEQGAEPEPGPEPDSGAVTWPAATTPLPTDVVTWASAGVVHVGDDTALDAGTPIQAYVVAGDSAWVVGEESDALLRVSADGVDDTGAHAETDSLLASPDGRYLGFLDPASGEPDRYDTPRLEAVVVDLQTGEEVLRTTEGMGDLAEDDLADLYEDASYGFLALTDDTAWVAPPAGDTYAVDLGTGEVTEVPGDDEPTYADDLVNADGSWSVRGGVNNDRARFVSADGQRVEPGDPSRSLLLSRWVDDATAVGVASDARLVTGPQDPATVVRLVACTVPDGACSPVPGATGPRSDLLLPHTSPYVVPTR